MSDDYLKEALFTEHQRGKSILADEPQPVAAKTPNDEVIQRLAVLPPLEYDKVRKSEAEALGVRAGTLDKLVAATRRDASSGPNIDFDDVEPHPEPVEPAGLLSEISSTVRRFIVCAEETAIAVALWVAMTWLIDVVHVAPLAVVTAPEKRCGKSQLLFLLGRLCYRPLTASNISPAALFRAIDAWRPTLLVDEADAFMRENEELRGILNCGHTRDSAYIIRTVGDEHIPQRFNVWGCKALAGIGHLADTLMDRSIVLELRRKLPHENVERLRHAESDLFEILAVKLARFAEDYREAVRRARPDLPHELNDRAQDNWEPLLAIADVAGAEWPKLARDAAKKISGAESPAQSIGAELLADIQEVFEEKKVDRLSTVNLIAALCADEERPWATYNRGRAISPRQVSSRLAEYGMKSRNIRVGLEISKGYHHEQFVDAFSRYLVSPPATSATTSQTSNDALSHVADSLPVAATQKHCATLKPAWNNDCSGVADKNPLLRDAEVF